MPPHLLLIAQEGPAREAYQRLLQPVTTDYEVVGSLADARVALSEKAYHALLLDVVTIIRSSQEEKSELHAPMSLFPVVRLKHGAEDGQIQAVYMGRAGGEHVDLAQFILERCPHFEPRRVRRHERTDYHLNVVLAGDALFTPDRAQRTNTLNISEGGCFVYTVWDWAIGAEVWLQFADLADDSPVSGTIVRAVHWGTPGLMPGVGIQFDRITPAQVSEIRVLRRCHSE